MFDRLSNNDINNALDELTACFGVREEMPFHNLIALLKRKDVKRCAQEIAFQLGLPINISLSYVPKDFKPGNTDGFRSSALTRTDWTGHGIGGIIAQVTIPQYIPMFGSPELRNYPIKVRVSEDCHTCPETFIAIMAHELSHVLLASVWSTHKDSELHTDLVPILLGFREIVRRGRRRVDVTTNSDTTTTTTTTYGYLTDTQFEYGCNYVSSRLNQHVHNKERLLKLVEQIQKKIRMAAQSLATFRYYFGYLDRHPPKRMKKEHAERLVQLHGEDYGCEWESRIKVVKKNMEIAEIFIRPLNHYTTSTIDHLKNHTRVLELALGELEQVTEAITRDQKMLGKYVGLFYKLQRVLGVRSSLILEEKNKQCEQPIVRNKMSLTSMIMGLVGWGMVILDILLNLFISLFNIVIPGLGDIMGCCILPLTCVPPIAWFLAIIFGIVGINQIKHTGESGSRMAKAGLIMGIIGIVLIIIGLFIVIIIGGIGILAS